MFLGPVLLFMLFAGLAISIDKELRASSPKPVPEPLPPITVHPTPQTRMGYAIPLLSAHPASHTLRRFFLRVPMAYVQQLRASGPSKKYLPREASGQKRLLSDVRVRLQASGLRDVQAVMQDPTDASRFTALARGIARVDPVVRIERSEPVEDGPRALNARPDPEGALDPGLTQDEVATIRDALLKEENPRHLSGLAATLEPFYPTSSSLLRARAMLMEARMARNMTRMRSDNDALGNKLREHVAKGGGDAASISDWTRVSGSVGQALGEITHPNWQDVRGMWKQISEGMPDTWHSIDRLSQAFGSEAKTSEAPIANLRTRFLSYVQKAGVPIDMAQDDVRRVACSIVEDAHALLHAGPEEAKRMASVLSDRLAKLPPEVRELGRRVVREIGLGVWIVCPKLMAEACPPTGGEGYVSPSALQLALATWKPEWSRVQDPTKIPDRLKELQGTGLDAARARHQMERAERALERRRWIDWYRRRKEAGLGQ